MPNAPAALARAATTLAALQAHAMLAGVLVLSACVVMAVCGPLLVPGWVDARTWATGVTAVGGLLMIVAQGLLMRRLLKGAAARVDRALDAAEEATSAMHWLQARCDAAELAQQVSEAWLPAPTPVHAQLDAPAHDALTGLHTARAFEHAVARWLQAAPDGQPAALLLIDLDRFRQINERAGRKAGDAVLRQAADVLRAHVRAGDCVARLEDDTYAMLLPGCVAEVALQMGQRLQAALATLGIEHAGRRLGVGATVGVAAREPAQAGRDAASSERRAADWTARARAAWYEAKYGGRGAVRVSAGAAGLPAVVAT